MQPVPAVWDQHQSDQAAATTQEESEARLVSQIWDQSNRTLTIQNLSNTEISQLYETLYLYGPLKKTPQRTIAVANLQIIISNQMPPCSSLTIRQNGDDVRQELKTLIKQGAKINVDIDMPASNEDTYIAGPYYLTFTDAQGRMWMENSQDDTLYTPGQSEPIGPSINLPGGYIDFEGTAKPNSCQ